MLEKDQRSLHLGKISPVHLCMDRCPAIGAGLASYWPEDQPGAHLPVEYRVSPAWSLIGHGLVNLEEWPGQLGGGLSLTLEHVYSSFCGIQSTWDFLL